MTIKENRTELQSFLVDEVEALIRSKICTGYFQMDFLDSLRDLCQKNVNEYKIGEYSMDDDSDIKHFIIKVIAPKREDQFHVVVPKKHILETIDKRIEDIYTLISSNSFLDLREIENENS
jgi:hypothetical protein